MALPESISAYEDCFDYWEQAQVKEKGIRLLFPDRKAAGIFRMRMNMSRVLERREAARLYERSDPRWGKSENDKFRVAVRPTAEGDGKFWVYIEPWKSDALEVEDVE